jgi:hypothetical protein
MRQRALGAVFGVLLCGHVLAVQVSPVQVKHPPRIGIISDEKTQAQADLLTIELQKKSCEMVERDEIKKVLQEQALSLSGLTGKDGLRVGQIVRADGLVLLTSHTNGTVLVRLVAVAPGVIVWFAEFHPPEDQAKDVESWARLVGSIVSGYLPKLSVQRDEALPISLLRIRPAFGTAHAEALANDLNRLMQLRLVREPSLFVLERENLRQMDEEQRWSGKDSEFWAGSYVLDGTITHDPTQTNDLTFTLSILSAQATKKGAPATTIIEKGRPGQLDAMVERATRSVCATLNATASTNQWNVTQEGRLFMQMASRLPDRRQQKIALETAMALGSRDIKTASSYRGVLQEICFRGTRFYTVNALADGADRTVQARDVLEYVTFQNSYRPPEGFTPDTEKKWLYSYFVPLSDAIDYLQLVEQTRCANDIEDWLPDIQEQCRQLIDRMFRLDPKLPNTEHACTFYRWAPYLYSRTLDILDLHRRGKVLLTDRSKAVPVFPSEVTESVAQQESLWQEYCREQQTAGSTETRYVLWSKKAVETIRHASLEERSALRRQFRNDALAHREFWPYVAGADNLVYCLFPLLWNDGNTSSEDQWRDWLGPITSADAKEILQCGREFTLALLNTVPTNASALAWGTRWQQPNDPRTGFPYLKLYSCAEAKEICAAILKRDNLLTNVVTAQKTDLTPMRNVLWDRFPEIADEAYKAAKAAQTTAQATARKAEREANERFQQNALRVTNKLETPACRETFMPRLVEGIVPVFYYVSKGWVGGKLWIRWQGDIVAFDPVARKFECIPEPALKPGYPEFAVTESSILYWLPKRDGNRPSDSSCTLSVHSMKGGTWRTFELPFGIGNCAEIGRKLYLSIAMTVPGSPYPKLGLITLDPETLKTETVCDPNVPRMAIDRKTMEIPFEALSFWDLRDKQDCIIPVFAVGNELIGACNRKCYAWDPATKKVRPFADEEIAASTNRPVQYHQASRRFGFTIVQGLHDRNGISALTVRRNGSTEDVAVPVIVDDPVRHQRSRSGRPESVLTPCSIVLPMVSPCGDTFRRSLMELPYSDIEKWLAVNAPQKHIAGTMVESSGVVTNQTATAIAK